MTNDSCDTVVFDLGGVLIDWDPRHLYRSLFRGDQAAMERFLSEVCTPAWNQQQDAGRPWTEAVAVLSAGRVLWQTYFSETDMHSVREEFKLNRADVGWYQIRNALKRRNADGENIEIDFEPFEKSYKVLSEKLQPQVYDLGFLMA